MSGWLEKRSGGKEGERSMSSKALGREHWNARWFVLRKGQLSYFKTDVEAQLAKRHACPVVDALHKGGDGVIDRERMRVFFASE